MGCAYVAEWLAGDGGVVALETGVGGAAFVATDARSIRMWTDSKECNYVMEGGR